MPDRDATSMPYSPRLPYCEANGCIEVSTMVRFIALPDEFEPYVVLESTQTGTTMHAGFREWASLVARVKHGEFDGWTPCADCGALNNAHPIECSEMK